MGLAKKSQSHHGHMPWLDKLGITASVGCAIHCIMTGLLFLTLPGLFELSHNHLSFHFMSSEWVHWVLALVVIPVALYSLSRGYRLHKKKLTLVFGGLGVGLLLVGLLAHPHPMETLFTFSGGVFLALAHFINLTGGSACTPHNHKHHHTYETHQH